MKLYNGQCLIKDFEQSCPSIRFEYVICIFLLLESIVTLGIDDDYVVCRCSKCMWSREKKKLLGKRLVFTTLDFDINIQHPYKPLVLTIRKFHVTTNTLAQVAWNSVNDG
jgi:hypothetical protein